MTEKENTVTYRGKFRDTLLRAAWVYAYAALLRVFSLLRWLEGGRRRAAGTAANPTGRAARNDRSQKAGIVLCLLLGVWLLGVAGCRTSPQARAEKHFARAQQWLKDGKPNEAMIELRRAVQLQPSMAKAHHELAKLYVQQGVFQSGYQELLLTVQYDQENYDAHLGIAELLLQARDFAKAKEKADLILEKWPQDRSATLVLAESLVGLGELDAAQKLFGQVLQAEPRSARALVDLAALRVRKKE